MTKDYSIWNEKLSEIISSYDGIITIGFIGALGTHDIGDEAMLISNCEKLKKIRSEKINFKVFSMNPKNTDNYLKTKSSHFSFKFLTKSFLYRLCSLVDRKIQEPFLKDKKHLDLFSEFYAISWFLINTVKIRFGFIPKKYQDHIIKIKELDLLYIIGGAYLNSWHVKSKIFSFLLEIEIAQKYDKNVVLSGLNLGPFNFIDRFFVKYVFSKDNVRLIGIRDWDESLKEIDYNNFIARNRIYYSHDDAFYLEYNLEHNPYKDKKYIVLQAHYWIASKSKKNKVKDIYKSAISYAVDNGLEVVFISMQSYPGNRDYLFAKETISELDEMYSEQVSLPEIIYSPKVLKKIISDARMLISTRHHPFLFAVSSNVFAISISYDDYYTQKFKGIANEKSHIFSINDDSEDIELFCKKIIEEFK